MNEIESTQPLPKKISLGTSTHFDREGFSGDVYVDPEDGLGFSALMVDVHGRHPLKRMIDATRIYLVVKGQGTFTLNGQATEVKEGDLLVIPDSGEYKYEGSMQLFEFNVPGTTSKHSITLEE